VQESFKAFIDKGFGALGGSDSLWLDCLGNSHCDHYLGAEALTFWDFLLVISLSKSKSLGWPLGRRLEVRGLRYA
jgi:hypothetical protein